MHNRDYLDLGRLMDEIFRATETVTNSFGDFGFQFQKNAEHNNYYAVYPFPPANIYMRPDKTLVFQFALAGYRDEDISLQFQGEHMILSASAPPCDDMADDMIYFNRRLKHKAIPDQKYYVPEDKYDRESAKAIFKNGILKVSIPPRDEVKNPEGVKIEIVNEDM